MTGSRFCDQWTGKQMDRQMDGWMDEWTKLIQANRDYRPPGENGKELIIHFDLLL